MSLVDEIKKSEGFRGIPYNDSLGVLTIGYGTKLALSEEEGELLLRHRLKKKKQELLKAKPMVSVLEKRKKKVLFEMVYQLGVRGVLLFNRMWIALEKGDFDMASVEMLDSAWAKQTPERAKRLSEIMRR